MTPPRITADPARQADIVLYGWDVLGRAEQLPQPPAEQQKVNAAKTALTTALIRRSRLGRADTAPDPAEVDAAALEVAEKTTGLIEAVTGHYGVDTARKVAGQAGGTGK